MRMLAKLTGLLPLLLLTGAMTICLSYSGAAQSFSLYTPFTDISVAPGQNIDYPIDVINKGSSARTADLQVTGLPKGWTYELKSGGWSVRSISVLPGDRKELTLQVQVPYQVNKGRYHFLVSAPGASQLPLGVMVSQSGSLTTGFTTDQPNLAGAAKSTFTFNAKLRNSTAGNQVYALSAPAPPGWNIVFKASYKQVASVSIDANHTQDLTIEVTAPEQIAAGNYTIPVEASSGASTADLTLQVTVTGSYGLQLTTPTGVLSTAVTAGNDKKIELAVRNSGSAPLKDIELQSAAPANWTVSFEPQKIESLPPGQSVQVFATLTPDSKAIAGDYMANLVARTPETSSTAALRVSVETSLLWSWSGILIILIALGAVFYLFRKYGRR